MFEDSYVAKQHNNIILRFFYTVNNRNIRIDTLRGIACILLVAFHVVGAPDSGLRIQGGFYREINDVFVFIRMPLFTFLSGIVYASRPFHKDIRLFVTGKIRRLLIPMLVVGTIFAIAQSKIGGTHYSVQDWKLIHVIPVAHYWFIESIFLIFMLMIPLELINVFNKKSTFIGLFFCSSIIYLSSFEFNYFSVSGAIYLFPFFLMGIATQKYSLIEYAQKYIGWVLAIIVFGLLTAMYFHAIPITDKRTLLGLFIGNLFCLALFYLKIENRTLSRIGYFSYSIYLFHVFFTAGTRMVLYKIGITNINKLFTLSLILGILGPILVELVFNKVNFTRIFFLGKKKRITQRAVDLKYMV